MGIYFVYYFTSKDVDLNNIIANKILFVIAFFSGWSNESIVIPFFIALFLYYCKNFRKLQHEKHIAFVFYCIGTLLLIIAPGNYVREGNGIPLSLSSIFGYLKLLRVSYLFIILLTFVYIKRKDILFLWLKEYIYLLIGFIIGNILFAYLGPVALRVGYGVEFLSVILLCTLLKYLMPKNKIESIGRFSYAIFACFLAFILFLQMYCSHIITDNIAQIESNKDYNCKVIVKGVIIKDPLGKYVKQYSDPSTPSWNTEVWNWYYGKEIEYVNKR